MSEDGNSSQAVRVRISGRVQGVWYRAWVRETVERMGLTGWVRNRLDGSVEALFVGPESDVEAMIKACWTGPPAAQVDHIETTPAQGIAPNRFDIKPTV